MNGKKARALRKVNPVDHELNAVIKGLRAAQTQDQRQDLALEKAEIKAEGKPDPYRHLASRLNYKAVAR